MTRVDEITRKGPRHIHLVRAYLLACVEVGEVVDARKHDMDPCSMPCPSPHIQRPD